MKSSDLKLFQVTFRFLFWGGVEMEHRLKMGLRLIIYIYIYIYLIVSWWRKCCLLIFPYEGFFHCLFKDFGLKRNFTKDKVNDGFQISYSAKV